MTMASSCTLLLAKFYCYTLYNSCGTLYIDQQVADWPSLQSQL